MLASGRSANGLRQELLRIFEPDDECYNFRIDTGFGNVTAMFENIWKKTAKSKFQSDDGGKRARMTAIYLRERDGLHGRLFDVRCPGYKRCIANAEQNIRSS